MKPSTIIQPEHPPEYYIARRQRLAELRQKDMEERRVVLSTFPAELTLEMTTRCNLTCAHCRRFHVQEEGSLTRGVYGEDEIADVVGSSGYMGEEVFDKCVDMARDSDWISITGYGEPLMHPRYFDFAKRLKAQGHVLDTISNGILLNQKNVDKLVDMQFDMISVSLDGATQKTLKIARGVDADVVFSGLERIAQAKRDRGLGQHDPVRISANFTMARYNIRELPALARKLAKLDVHVLYGHVLATAASSEILGPQLIYTDPKVREESVKLVEEAKAICADHDIHTNFKRIPEVGDGNHEEGVSLDTAIDDLEAAKVKRNLPRRIYRPLKEIEEERNWLAENAPELAPDTYESKFAKPCQLSEKTLEENKRCLDLFRYAQVSWNGKVLSCDHERFGVGDLNLSSAEEVWNGPEYRKLRAGVFEDGIRWVCHGCSKIYD